MEYLKICKDNLNCTDECVLTECSYTNECLHATECCMFKCHAARLRDNGTPIIWVLSLLVLCLLMVLLTLVILWIRKDSNRPVSETDNTRHPSPVSTPINNVFLSAGLELPEVNHLSLLPLKWQNSTIPREMEQFATSAIKRQYRSIMNLCNSTPVEVGNLAKMSVAIWDLCEKSRSVWDERITMYETSLKSHKARLQVVSLIHYLETLESYEGASKLIKVQEIESLQTWNKCVQRWEGVHGRKHIQTTSSLARCYRDACLIKHQFDAYLKKVAIDTHGTNTVVGLKHIFRAMEKAAMQHDNMQRHRCDNIFDLTRGALVYKNMKGLIRGFVRITGDEEIFIVTRVKNRFAETKQARGGWQDCIINGYFKGDNNRHIVEIQLQHHQMLNIRLHQKGHKLYSILRALVEACTTTFGEVPESSDLEKCEKPKAIRKWRSKSAVHPGTLRTKSASVLSTRHMHCNNGTNGLNGPKSRVFVTIDKVP